MTQRTRYGGLWTFAAEPARFLTMSNGAAAALTAVMAVYVARVLGPEQLGVRAVVTAITGSVLAFFDVRLNDVAARAFFQVDGSRGLEDGAYQAAVLELALLGNGLIALGSAVLAAGAGALALPLFTHTPVDGWWLPVAAGTTAAGTIGATFLYLPRLTGGFFAIGTCRILMQLVMLGAVIGVLTLMPTISGSFIGFGIASVLALLITAAGAVIHWSRLPNLPLRRPSWRPAWEQYRACLRIVFYGNLLSYAKLLQRGTDVLLVAHFGNDRETGLYRLARTVVDSGLEILRDALYQVNYPRLLRAFSARAAGEFHAIARRLMTISAVLTMLLVAGEAVLLAPLLNHLVGPAYSGAQPAIMLYTVAFAFLAGVYPWLWAVFIGTGRLRGYTIAVFAGVAAQYAVAVLLFTLVGASATAAMIGVLAYYLVLAPVAHWLARRQAVEHFPKQAGPLLAPSPLS